MGTLQVIPGLVFTAPGRKQGFVVERLEKGYVVIQPFDDECCYSMFNKDGKPWVVLHECLTDTSQWILNKEPEDWFPEDLMEKLSAIPTQGMNHNYN